MSELEKSAPNEIYLIVGDADKDCNFNELAEVTWADKPVYEETAIKYVKSSQLTIPESEANKLIDDWEKEKAVLIFAEDLYHSAKLSPLASWKNTNGHYQHNVSLIYLAGKALGVELVKVVEG